MSSVETTAYRSADGRERTSRTVLVRARHAAIVWQGIGGYIRKEEVPAGTQLRALAGQSWSGVPADPCALFTVIHHGRAYAAQPTYWAEVS